MGGSVDPPAITQYPLYEERTCPVCVEVEGGGVVLTDMVVWTEAHFFSTGLLLQGKGWDHTELSRHHLLSFVVSAGDK